MTVIEVGSRVRLKFKVELAAASFRVSTMSVLLGIGSVDASLNTNSTSACTFDPARVLEKALEKKLCFTVKNYIHRYVSVGYVYVYIYIYICIYMYMYIYIYIYIYIYVYIYIYICIYIYVYICIYIYIYIYIYAFYLYTFYTFIYIKNLCRKDTSLCC